MNKTVKLLLIATGGLVGLMAVALAVLTLTFNPNDYKPLIVKMVKEKKQRTLNIEGDIKLAFWPKIGADLGKVSISEHNGDKEFASVQGAKVFLAVMPLLRKELVIDTVYVDGVKANIVRFKDGTTNFDDLMSKEESEEIKFNIDGVVVSNAALNLTDEMGNRHVSVDSLNLKTGHIAKNEPIDLETQFHVQADNPKVDAKGQVKGRLLADTEHKLFTAKHLDAALQGNVAGASGLDVKISGDLEARPETTEFLLDSLKLSAKANLDGQALALELATPSLTVQKDEVSGKNVSLSFSKGQGEDMLTAKFAIDDIKGSPKAFQSSGITGEISGKQGARTLSGKFSSPITGNLETQVFELPKLIGNVDVKDPTLPNDGAKIAFDLDARADLKQKLAAAGLNVNINGSNVKGKLDVAGFEKPNVKFDLTADQLDLNSLLGKPQAAAKPAANKPGDLNALKDVLAQGSINIGSIAYDQYRIANFTATVKADGQALTVKPLSLKLDDSQIKGQVGISHFDKPLYTFDLDIDRVDADRYAPKGAGTQAKADNKPLDLSALKALNAEGSLRIGSLKSGKVNASNIRVDVKADGDKVKVDPLSLKLDDSNINASLGVSRLENPVFSFNVAIDKLDADRYVTQSQPAAKSTGDTPLDLTPLKTLNAGGDAKIGVFKLANVKATNVKLSLKAEGGQVALAPFSADLYQGSMAGALNVDARAMPAIALKQDMKNIAIGPLLVDAINNNMLDGKGTLSVDVKTQGATVGALKKALNGNAAVNLADGAVKGFDLAGTLREVKTKLNVFKSQDSISSDKQKKTDFSEMKASFVIKNGVAHNDDLAMKAPLFRITGSGDIDIGNEKLNYLAKPTVVASLKGQGGAELQALNGITIPVKLTGTFSDPKYAPDFSAMGTALAQKNLLGNVGGSKAGAALQGMIGGQAASPQAAPSGQPAAPAQPTPADQTKKKLNKLLGL